MLTILCTLNVIPVAAEESTTANLPSADCRYEGNGSVRKDHAGSSRTELFPENDVFRPLLADPKQPQFFAAYQGTRVRTTNQSVNIGSVGLGENFGLVGNRNGCDGWQVGILGGVFAQFNLDSASSDLINADYVIGVPVSWRSGLFSTRARLYHQSSHLGDEFLLRQSRSQSRESEFRGGRGDCFSRCAGRMGTRVRRRKLSGASDTATLDRNGVRWGFELRGPAIVAPMLGTQLPGFRLTPVFGADFKSFEELNWIINNNVVGGLEWSKANSNRRVRLLLNYYHGFAPYGQFFAQKVEWFGVGLYLLF